MGLHRGSLAYVRCDAPRNEHGQPCTAFLVPAPTGDPFGPGHVFAGGWHAFEAAARQGWQAPQGAPGGPWLCPDHRSSDPAAVRPEWDDDSPDDVVAMYRKATIGEVADHLHGMALRGGSDRITDALLAAAKVVRGMADEPARPTALIAVGSA